MNALFQRRFFARNVHKMPTVSTLYSTSSTSTSISIIATEEKTPDVKTTTSPDVKKEEVHEVKRMDEAKTDTTFTATKESVVVVEKPQVEVPKVV